MKISNIQELKEFILNNELSKKQISKLVKVTLNVIILKDYKKNDLALKIEEFYNKYPNIENRPIFLDREYY